MSAASSHEQELRSLSVGELLPHGEAFRMVDSLLYCDGTRTVTETVVPQEGYLHDDNGHLAPVWFLENMAQTCAVRMGFLSAREGKVQARPGVIAAVRRMEVYGPAGAGDVLQTEVVVEAEAFGMMSCTGRIESDGRTVAEAELKLMV
ncbi:MAG: hypothetical protein IJC23_06080 [Bacteroidaceae bacterium]|nr:hypothetical protein [Bacteroidaceae bacterium]